MPSKNNPFLVVVASKAGNYHQKKYPKEYTNGRAYQQP
jgi:hypothetical protein